LKRIVSSPESTGAGKLPVHATFKHYESEAEALALAASPYYKSLSGKWKFRFPVPERYARRRLEARWPLVRVAVPGCWDMQGFDRPQYLNIIMPFDETPPKAPAVNPTGLYSLDFDIPESWSGRRLILHFDGVENCFVPSLNGNVLGFSKDSRGDSEFDVTEFAKPGFNELKILVSKYSDASFIEDQDQWWHAGIVRKVYIYAVRPDHIEDLFAAATLDESLKNGELKLTLNAHIVPAKGKRGDSISNGQVELSRARKPGGGLELRGQFVRRRRKDRLQGKLSCGAPPRLRPLFRPERSEPFLFRREDLHPRRQALERREPLSLYPERPAPRRVRSSFDATSIKIGFAGWRPSTGSLINGKPVLIAGVQRHEHDDRAGRNADPSG
jgi:beta-galactosidase